MTFKRGSLLLMCGAIGIVAFILLDFWKSRNDPLYMRLEQMWSDDIRQLEASSKLPKQWFDIQEIEMIGGTPESKSWLRRIKVPLKVKEGGCCKLEVLLVAWEETGTYGSLVQYNIVDLKTKNTLWELGRTFILAQEPGENR